MSPVEESKDFQVPLTASCVLKRTGKTSIDLEGNGPNTGELLKKPSLLHV